jgi:hypothetical protein
MIRAPEWVEVHDFHFLRFSLDLAVVSGSLAAPIEAK